MSLVLKIAIFDGVVQYNARLGMTGNNQIWINQEVKLRWRRKL